VISFFIFYDLFLYFLTFSLQYAWHFIFDLLLIFLTNLFDIFLLFVFTITVIKSENPPSRPGGGGEGAGGLIFKIDTTSFLTEYSKIFGNPQKVGKVRGQEDRLSRVDVEEEGLHHPQPYLPQDHNRVRTREILQQISTKYISHWSTENKSATYCDV
jgi:hypothetical protein